MRKFKIIFLVLSFPLFLTLKANDISNGYQIKGENLEMLIDDDRENSEWVTQKIPQIQFDFDSDGIEESLFFFNNLGCVNCIFSKIDKSHRINEYLSEDFNDTHDTLVNVNEINVRFHDFDKDNIPEIIIEIKFNETEFTEIEGRVYKLYGTGATIKNLSGLNGWLKEVGKFWGQYEYAEIKDNVIKTINFRELPLYYVYIDNRLRSVE